jgi:cellulose synthase/poly-beta-1,6-N-acetylglucosamine synthase-like glycosyltransferase
LPFAQVLLLTIYYVLLGVVSAVMLYRGLLIVRYYRRPRGDESPAARFGTEPVVTVQLPLYNERFVVDRLLESVCAFDWPRDRLEVQVLDDSTDDTVEITARKVAELCARGFDVKHVHRTDRTGYKAGALGAALPEARGEFVAVFDADFVPEPDFLRHTVDHFTDPTVAFVQSRWAYLNRGYGPLTQGMGMLMDGHFVLEQVTRSRGGYIFNFNGTGGIWRRSAIDAGGGWHGDTICEDTDLSYRVQMEGFRGVFLRDLACPSELPVQITALKSQQHRWAKGLTECFLKLIPRIWRSSLPLKRKLEGTFHLGANLAFPAALFMTVVSLPVMLVRMQGAAQGSLAALVDSGVFMLVAVTQVLFYIIATRELHDDWVRRMKWLPFFPLVGVGLAVNNARGVMEAITGLKTEFVRTPKLGVLGEDRSLVKARERTYTGGRDFYQALVEIGLGGYYVYMAVMQASFMPMGAALTSVLSLGLFMMGGATLRALWLKSRATRRPESPAPASAADDGRGEPTAAPGRVPASIR